MLENFKDYGVVNEIYYLVLVLSHIFTGEESLSIATNGVAQIVQKCTVHDTPQRYQGGLDVVSDISKLDAALTEAIS